jgi:aspartate-semialdehyde dehydrogenase
MNIGIIGATGIVGKKLLYLLEVRKFPIIKLSVAASDSSIGKSMDFKNEQIFLISVEELFNKKLDIVFMMCSNNISEQWAPKFVEKGVYVIDNSSAFRMDPGIPLVIPEINGDCINSSTKLIANPNCSTAQLVMVLHPLHQKYHIKRVVVSTYQSVSGSGEAGVNQLLQERQKNGPMESGPYIGNIDKNCIPICDVLCNNGYTKEEIKIQEETCKILNTPIPITATAVRVPVLYCHCESVNIEFNKKVCAADIIKDLHECGTGIIVCDCPMPRDVEGKDEIYVGRIRDDFSRQNSVNMWIVGDNLMKGAALNSIQIAEHILILL